MALFSRRMKNNFNEFRKIVTKNSFSKWIKKLEFQKFVYFHVRKLLRFLNFYDSAGGTKPSSHVVISAAPKSKQLNHKKKFKITSHHLLSSSHLLYCSIQASLPKYLHLLESQPQTVLPVAHVISLQSSSYLIVVDDKLSESSVRTSRKTAMNITTRQYTTDFIVLQEWFTLCYFYIKFAALYFSIIIH